MYLHNIYLVDYLMQFEFLLKILIINSVNSSQVILLVLDYKFYKSGIKNCIPHMLIKVCFQ